MSADLRALYDREVRRGIAPPDGVRSATPRLVRIVLPPPRMSYVAYSDLAGLDDAGVGAVIDGEIAHFERHGGPFEWTLFGHDDPPDLIGHLGSRGFDIDEPEEVMTLDLTGELTSLMGRQHAPVREIGAEGLSAVQELSEQVWERDFSGLRIRLENHLRVPGYLRMFVAEVDGVTASAAWIYLHPGIRFAGLYGGSTLPAYRGRGLYSALLAARAAVAREAGYRYLTIDAGPMSRPIAFRHGFEPLAWARACVWRPPETG
jgi:GNAT superfamily N-acetyltransferase